MLMPKPCSGDLNCNAVADPGFDLRGRGHCQRGRGRKSSESVVG